MQLHVLLKPLILGQNTLLTAENRAFASISSWRKGTCSGLATTGEYAAARPLFERALEARERVLGPEHPDTLTSVNNLALLLHSQGDCAAARSLYERALEARERVLGTEHPDTLTSVNSLAALLHSQGEYAAARPLYERALEARERVLGPNHPDTLNSMAWLADTLEKLGQDEEAGELRLRLAEIQSSRPDLTPLDRLQLAGQCFRLGETEKAKEQLALVLDADYEVPSTHCHLARICLLTDADDEARQHGAEAWDHRAEARAYVIARILWFKLVFAMLDTTDPAPILGHMKTVFTDDDAFMEWTMQPVLDHLAPRLAPDDLALLTALVAALSDRSKLPDLDGFPRWRDAKPQALD